LGEDGGGEDKGEKEEFHYNAFLLDIEQNLLYYVVWFN